MVTYISITKTHLILITNSLVIGRNMVFIKRGRPLTKSSLVPTRTKLICDVEFFLYLNGCFLLPGLLLLIYLRN